MAEMKMKQPQQLDAAAALAVFGVDLSKILVARRQGYCS